MIKNTQETYGSVAKFFHWAIFLLLLVMLSVGYFLGDFPESIQGTVYNIHKLTGLTILALILLRLFWALMNPKPRLPSDTKKWEKIAEHVVQYSLYVAVIVMPIVAWVGVSAAGRPPKLGSLSLGLPFAVDKEFAKAMLNLHGTVAIILITLICVHLLAALFHHFIKKDNVLRRMLPGQRD